MHPAPSDANRPGLVELGPCVRPPLCCSSYRYTNLGLLLAWPLFVTLPVYLLVTRLSWMNGWLLALLGWALLCVVLHTIVVATHIRRRSCPKPQDHPSQQLLASAPASDKKAEVSAPAQVNPFGHSYGLIPGTSQYGYVIFIPPSDLPGERRSGQGHGVPLSPDATHSVSHRAISPSRVGGSSSQILAQHHPSSGSEGNLIGQNHYQQQEPPPAEGRARTGQAPPKPPRAPARFVSIDPAAGQAEGRL
ncbi:MAG: hypothetical protein WDW36_008752 [Sanguina aurantia]